GRQDNAWLLIKHPDKYASETDITLKTKSVISKRTLHGVETAKDKKVWSRQGDTKGTKSKTITKKGVEEEKENTVGIQPLLKNIKRSAFPTTVKPMLATRVDKPFDNEDWIYEIKWDGYRAVSFIKNGKVEMKSRHD